MQEFPSTTAEYWRWDIKTRHSQWQVWVGEVEFYEVRHPHLVLIILT